MNFADHDHGMLPECGHDALDAVSHVAGRVRLCGCMPGFRCRNSTGRSVPARDALRKPVLDLFERAGIPAAKGRSQRSFLKMPPTSQQQATDQGAKRDSPNGGMKRPLPDERHEGVGGHPQARLLSCFVENPQHFVGEPVAEARRVQPEQPFVDSTVHEALPDSAARRCNLASRSTVSRRTRSASRTRRPNSVSR